MRVGFGYLNIGCALVRCSSNAHWIYFLVSTPTGPRFLLAWASDDILVAADLLEDGRLELCKVRFSMLGAEVSWNGSFKISNTFSNFMGRLVGLPHTVDS
jgi:hypothetical protein